MPSVFSYFSGGATPRAVRLEAAETHNLETSSDKTAKSALYLIKANHVNHSLLYNQNRFHNHVAHILSSAYLLGATEDQLRAIYEAESAELEAWTPSPAEVIDEDWMDFRGDKTYQRAFLDYFEDKLAMEYAYDWKKLVMDMLFAGKEPLFNGLVSGLAHPIIHLAYAFEMDSKEIAIEALAMSCACYNYLHKYLDDAKYTKKSPIGSASLQELLKRLSTDARFDPIGDGSDFRSTNSEFILTDYLEPILEYWNAWDMEDPTLQLKSVQQVSASILVGTESPHNKAYNFFFAHLLTSSHAMRIIIPLLPVEHHVNVLRQWWLLTLLIYIGKARPAIDPGNIGTDTGGRDWSYVVDRALNSPYAKDAHYVKVIRSLQEAEKTWGKESQEFLLCAVTFVDNFEKWVY